MPKARCKFWWADGDGCELPLDHEGPHQVFGPKCESVMPQSSVRCQEIWFHEGPHRATVPFSWEDS